MKTKNSFFNSVKLSAIAAILIVLSACSASSSQSASSAEEKRISPPAVDLNTAALTGNLKAVKQHVDAGTDLNQKEPFGGSTPLITAIVFGKTEAANMLIDAGTDLNVKNNDGATALHVAAFFCHKEIVQTLLDKGANPTIKNNYNATPYESLMGTWEEVKPIYEMQEAMLGAYGMQLDYARIERTRPVIAEILK